MCPLPPPKPLPLPSGLLARHFFSFSPSKSNESHMRTLLHLHTRTNSPLLKRGQSQLLPPPGRHSSPWLASFSPLLTFAMPTPPSRHSKAKTNGCQSKQHACTRTRVHLACLLSEAEVHHCSCRFFNSTNFF